MCAFWMAAIVFFGKRVTSWTLSPAESRALNVDCTVADFFDYHDTWHCLSA